MACIIIAPLFRVFSKLIYLLEEIYYILDKNLLVTYNIIPHLDGDLPLRYFIFN